MKLKDLFRKKSVEPEKKPEKKAGCSLCRPVATSGRSGEQVMHFVDDDEVTVEIINQSNVEGRLCYSLFIMNDAECGWNEMPIKYCPRCGISLKKVGK